MSLTPAERAVLTIEKARNKKDTNHAIKAREEGYRNGYEAWTDEEDTLLTKLYEEGEKQTHIAKQLGRSKGALAARLKRLKLVQTTPTKTNKTKPRGYKKTIAPTPDFSNITLTGTAKEAFDEMLTGKNIFLTGKAGTGKSTIIQKFLSETNKRCVKLAPTGIAAQHIGGQTIHSFIGLRPQHDMSTTPHAKDPELLEKIETVIIDEVSMLRVDLFDVLERFLRENTSSNKPFGGKQLILVGDLFQLEPVVRGEKTQLVKQYGGVYFFFLPALLRTNIHMLQLEQVHRQNDAIFVDLLNKIRDKTVSQAELEQLNQKCVKPQSQDGDICILTTINAKAHDHNYSKLESLEGEELISPMQVHDKADAKKIIADEVLIFKKGAKVMMLTNHPEGKRSNGSMGEVTEIISDGDDIDSVRIQINGQEHCVEQHERGFFEPTYDEESDTIQQMQVGAVKQFPFKLGRARTIHKGQGITLDQAHVDLGHGTFSHGHLYVALSRARNLEGLSFSRPLRMSDIIVDPEIKNYYHQSAIHYQLQARKKAGETITIQGKKTITLDPDFRTMLVRKGKQLPQGTLSIQHRHIQHAYRLFISTKLPDTDKEIYIELSVLETGEQGFAIARDKATVHQA